MLNSKERLLDAMTEAEAGFEVSPASLIRLVVGWMNDIELRVEEVDDDCANLSATTVKHIGKLVETGESTSEAMLRVAELANALSKRVVLLEARNDVLQAHIDMVVAGLIYRDGPSLVTATLLEKSVDAYRAASKVFLDLKEPV